MSITNVGTGAASPTNGFSITPASTSSFYLLTVTCTGTTTSWATSVTSSNITWTPFTLGGSAHQVFPNNGVTQAMFIGKVNTAAATTVTAAFNTGTPSVRIGYQQFNTTVGFASLTLDSFGLIDTLASGIFPSVTPGAAGRTYWSFGFDNGTAVAGTTTGYTYFVDANGNIQARNTSCTGAVQQPNIGDTATDGLSAIAVIIFEAGTPVPSPFSAPRGIVRGRPAAARSRLSLPPFPPANPPASPFTPPAKLARGKAAKAKGRLSGSAGSPVVPPTPSPFSPSAAIQRAHAILRKARLKSSPGSPVVPAATSPFTPPVKPVRGKPAARKSRLAGSAGSPAVVPPITPAPFSAPALLKRGKAAIRKARLGASAGSPAALTEITVAGTWTGASAVASGFFFPFPSSQPLQIAITNTPGDWVFALVSWRPSTTGSGVSVVVADDAHNWWEPVGNPTADSGAAGVVRTALWAAPAARVANSETGVTVVQVAATGPVLGVAATIVDMNGLLPWYQGAAISPNFANAATSLSLSAGAPAAKALLFAAFGSDDNSKTITGPSGWTTLPGASATNGTDHTADIKLTPAWQVTVGSSTASVSSSGSLDLSGVIAGVLVSAPQPVQPNPDWPVMLTEVAIGSGVRTPPSEMTWTTLGGRSLGLQIQQGRMYSLGQLQAGQGTITLDDPDGELIPPGTGPYAGIDSGTPLRRRVAWPGLPGVPNLTPHYVAFSGFIRRWPWNMDASILRGQVIAEITDAWGYGNGPLNAMAIEECLLDSPHSLWPLTDPPGSTGAGNLVPNGAPLPLVTSKFGAGGAVITWGANSGGLLGMSSAQVTASGTSGGASGMLQQELAGASLATSGFGFALAASDPAFPPLPGGATVETWCDIGVAAALAGIAGNAEFLIGTPGGTFNTAQSNFTNGMPVILGPLGVEPFPTPFSAGTVYFVVNDDGNGNYSLAGAPGGSVITPTSAGATVGTITPQFAWNPVILAARGINGTVAQLELNKSTGALIVRYRPAGATVDTLVTADSSRDWRIGFLTHFSLALTTTTWRLMVAGGGLVNATGTFSSALPATFATACFGGVMDRTTQGNVMPGLLALAGVYPGFSPQVRVLSRYQSGLTGMLGEAACDRVERLLEYAGLTGRRWLGRQSVTYEGDLLASGQDVGGQAAVSAISNVAQSTLPAYAAVAPTGDIVYRSKLYVWNEPVRWTLGDNTAAGEIPFSPGSVATDYDPTRVTAKVQLTQLDSQSVTTPSGVMSAATMADVAGTAADQYGGTPYQNTGYLFLDWSSAYNAGSSLIDLANWVQAVYAKPANRIAQVVVDASRYPAAWPFWAGAAVGDMVAVNVRLPTASTSPLISLIARITQTARSSQFTQESTTGSITATLDFAPEFNALTCDDPVRGLLNGSNVLPW